jgi:hypothetical protein
MLLDIVEPLMPLVPVVTLSDTASVSPLVVVLDMLLAMVLDMLLARLTVVMELLLVTERVMVLVTSRDPLEPLTPYRRDLVLATPLASLLDTPLENQLALAMEVDQALLLVEQVLLLDMAKARDMLWVLVLEMRTLLV